MFDAPLAAEGSSDQAKPVELPSLEIRPPARPVVVPLSPKRFKVQFTADQETHDLMRQAQDLLRHQIPDGDVAQVMTKDLKLAIQHLEKEKIAAIDRPRGGRGSDPRSRHIPAEVGRHYFGSGQSGAG